MGLLHHDASARVVALSTDQLVGRVDTADICIPDGRASAQHARIRWTGTAWEVRDLGSRNGTWVDGERIEVGVGAPIGEGSKLGFGTQDAPWTLANAEAPCAFLQPMDGGPPRLANGDVLVPGPAAPPDTLIHQRRPGVWVIATESDERPLRDREILTFGTARFLFRTASVIADTRENADAPPRVSDMTLKFAVSKDEEHVEMTIIYAGGVLKLPPRRNTYVLLTLARHRLDDRQLGGIPEADEGWTYTSDLVRELGYETEQRLNLDIFRIREQFSSAGVEDASDVVERRRPTGQLRIGVKDLVVMGG